MTPFPTIEETPSSVEGISPRAPDRKRSLGVGFKKLSWLLFPMLVSIPSMAQDMKQEIRRDAGEMQQSVESPMDYSAVRYQSGSRRDPFLNPLLLQKQSKQQRDEEIDRGQPPPGIAGTYISQLTFQGTSLSEETRVAVVRGADNRAYFLKEGDRLFDGYLKSVQPDLIILVRETKMRSGKILTQDVSKRLRRP